MKKIYAGFLVLVAFLIGNVAMAQGTNARISGKVMDSKGATLTGATVLVQNGSTGFKTGNVVNAEGNYDLRELPLGGPYTVSVSFVGYQESKPTKIMLGLGDHLSLDFQLKDGNELAAVVVTANSLKARTDRFGFSYHW